MDVESSPPAANPSIQAAPSKSGQQDAAGSGELRNLVRSVKYLAVVTGALCILTVFMLAGTTFTIVRLSKSATPVAEGQFLAIKGADGSSMPALVGGAMLNITKVYDSPDDRWLVDDLLQQPRGGGGGSGGAPSLATASTADSNKDVMAEATNNTTDSSDLSYLSTFPVSIVHQACIYVSQGLKQFTAVGYAKPQHLVAGHKYNQIEVVEATGCNTLGGVISARIKADGLIVEVHCPAGADRCVAFYDQSSFRYQLPPSNINPVNLSSIEFEEEEQDARHTNATATGAGGRRRRQQACAKEYDRRGNLLRGPCRPLPCTYANCNQCDWPASQNLEEGLIGSAKAAASLINPFFGLGVALFGGIVSESSKCCLVCKSGWTTSGCGCQPASNCFPADAEVTVRGRGVVKMEALQYGDEVLSIDYRSSAAALVYRPVYLFGHRDGGAMASYITMRTAATATAATAVTGIDDRQQLLQLSPRHYIQVCVAGCYAADSISEDGDQQQRRPNSTHKMTLEARYASDIRVGDVLVAALAAAGGSSGSQQQSVTVVVVEEVWVERARGVYNPFVRGADLVVNGLVASPHSDWLLDDVTPAPLRKYLPAIYEVMLTPVYGLYQLLGAARADWLASLLMESADSAHGGAGYFAVLSVMGAVVALPAATAVAGLKALRAARRPSSTS